MIAGKFVMTITDNGIGFDPAKVSDAHAVGLVGMRERAHLIGAAIDIESAPGRGAMIRLTVPLIDRS